MLSSGLSGNPSALSPEAVLGLDSSELCSLRLFLGRDERFNDLQHHSGLESSRLHFLLPSMLAPLQLLVLSS